MVLITTLKLNILIVTLIDINFELLVMPVIEMINFNPFGQREDTKERKNCITV